MKSQLKEKMDDLFRVRLGDYIFQSRANNRDLKYGTELIEGVTNEGLFTAPKGNPLDVDLAPYKIVNSGAFVYNPSRLDLGSIAYRTDGLCIVSHLYIVFYLNEKGKARIDPTYLYMYFRRNEFYREVRFRNFGSQRPEFNFNDMSEMMIPLPDIEIQRKYAGIYQAMVSNKQSYEYGLEDLRLTIDAQLDKVKKSSCNRPIKSLLHEIDNRNEDGAIKNVQGINITKQFMPSVADTTGVNLQNYKVVKTGQFAFSGMQTGRDECIRLALYRGKEPIIISPAYSVFEANEEALAEYIMTWFSRAESNRRGWFMSDSSIRTNLDLDRFYEIEIPVPDMKTQKIIADLQAVYVSRRDINEKLKRQIKDICPILIKGSLEEGKSHEH